MSTVITTFLIDVITLIVIVVMMVMRMIANYDCSSSSFFSPSSCSWLLSSFLVLELLLFHPRLCLLVLLLLYSEAKRFVRGLQRPWPVRYT